MRTKRVQATILVLAYCLSMPFVTVGPSQAVLGNQISDGTPGEAAKNLHKEVVRTAWKVADLLSGGHLTIAIAVKAPSDVSGDEFNEMLPPLALQQPEIAAIAFDLVLFGRGSDASAWRDRQELLLRQTIDSVNRLCSLTPEQKQKLRLGGHGDIKRLFDRIEEQRERFQFNTATELDEPALEKSIRELTRMKGPLNSGSFGNGSYFAKVLRLTLTPEQQAKYERRRSNLLPAQKRTVPDLAIAS